MRRCGATSRIRSGSPGRNDSDRVRPSDDDDRSRQTDCTEVATCREEHTDCRFADRGILDDIKSCSGHAERSDRTSSSTPRRPAQIGMDAVGPRGTHSRSDIWNVRCHLGPYAGRTNWPQPVACLGERYRRSRRRLCGLASRRQRSRPGIRARSRWQPLFRTPWVPHERLQL